MHILLQLPSQSFVHTKNIDQQSRKEKRIPPISINPLSFPLTSNLIYCLAHIISPFNVAKCVHLNSQNFAVYSNKKCKIYLEKNKEKRKDYHHYLSMMLHFLLLKYVQLLSLYSTRLYNFTKVDRISIIIMNFNFPDSLKIYTKLTILLYERCIYKIQISIKLLYSPCGMKTEQT